MTSKIWAGVAIGFAAANAMRFSCEGNLPGALVEFLYVVIVTIVFTAPEDWAIANPKNANNTLEERKP